MGVRGLLPPRPAEETFRHFNDQRTWAVGEASGKSQESAKDYGLETEFLIINKRPYWVLHRESLGCL